MKTNLRKTKYALLVFFSSALVLVGCRTGARSNLVTKTKMHQVKTAKKFNSLLEESKNNEDSTSNMLSGTVTDAVPTPEAGENDGGESKRDFSETNVQVSGVDEGDVIKTDGHQVIYAPRYTDKFYVFDVDDNYEITVTKAIAVPGAYIESLYLTPDYLVALSYGGFGGYVSPGTAEPTVDYETDDADFIYMPSPAFTGTKITLYERSNFTVAYELEFNFYISNHRLINNSLFFVGDHYLYGSDVLPVYRENAGETESTSYNDMYYFEDSYVNSLTVIGGLLLNQDASKISHSEKTYLTNYIYYREIYVSHEHLYILSSNYHYERTKSYQTTTISQHKLNISAATTSFVAASNVKGAILNQFSVDEYDGYLRIATTDFENSWRVHLNGNYDWDSFTQKVTNYLFILKANRSTSDFSLVGYIDEGLGKPGETIKSVRFDREKALIVTFLQTDPLYVINLTDPANPKITDAIELPGFDVYQHNWGTNRLLGFGYSATSAGIVNGMKLTAYDITEGSASELETYKINHEVREGAMVWTYSYSEALYNHRAMLVHVDKGLFGFPLDYYMTSVSSNNEYIYEYASAYYLFKINFDSDGQIISEPLKIKHGSSNDVYGYVDRAVMIDDYLYTFSGYGVVTLSLISEEITATIEL